MPNNHFLLQQIRGAMTAVRETSTDASHITRLAEAEMLANELLLQDEPAFYVAHIRYGSALLAEGLAIAARRDPAPLPAVALRADISVDLRHEILIAESAKLREGLLHVVERLQERGTPEEKAFLVRVSDWEAAFYQRSAAQVAPIPSRATNVTPEMLHAYLVRRWPAWKDLQLTGFVQLHGGFSKKTILFDTHDAVNGAQSLVLRLEQPILLLNADGSDVAREFPMIELMRRAGLPVAEPLWLEEDTGPLGHSFSVSRKARGQIIGDTMGSREPLPAAVLDSMLDTLFQMHAIRVSPDDPLAQRSHLAEWLPHRTVGETIRHFVTVHLPAMATRAHLEPSPALARAFIWLEQNVPTCDEPPVVLHMDFALNNLLIEDNRVATILDWETSRLGDPADEIRWTQLTLGQYISLPEFLRRYREGTGRDVTPYRLAYSKVAGAVYATIAGLNAVRCYDRYGDTPMNFTSMAFRYLPMLGFRFDALIAEAEAARDA